MQKETCMIMMCTFKMLSVCMSCIRNLYLAQEIFQEHGITLLLAHAMEGSKLRTQMARPA